MYLPGFNSTQLAIGFALAGVLAVVSHRLKVLSTSGSIGTLIVGTVVFGIGGWLYTIPLLFFFISSNLLSRLKSEIKVKSLRAIEKAGARDIWQVFANGGVATACVVAILISSDSRWFYLYLASLGASTADTWATEIGTLLSGKPRSIINFRLVNPGESGGVSIPGTLASLIGSAMTVCSVLPIAYDIVDPRLLAFAIFSGFSGSIIDSILGATVQASYRCAQCGAATETRIHCGNPTLLIRGLRIINNDAANILSNILAVTLLFLIIN